MVRVGQQNTDVADDAAHHSLAHVIGEIVFIRLAEVDFHNMAQGIEYTRKELLHRNGHGVGRVKKRKIRLSAPNRTLDFLFLVGDDRFAVHLAAGAEQCNDGAERDKLIWKGILRIFQLPNILV